LSLSVWGCKNKLHVVTERKVTAPSGVDMVLSNMKKNSFDCEWLSGKSNVTFEKGNSANSFKAVYRLRKDSVIWISFTAYGIEAGRVLLTPDSIWAINRLSSEYFIGSYDFLLARFGVDIDYESIQALMLGNPLDIDEQEKIRTYPDEGLVLVSGLRRKKLRKVIEKDKEPRKENRVYSVWLDPITYKVRKQSLYDFDTDKSIVLILEDFQPLGDHIFPLKATVKAKSDENIILKINHSGIVLNEPKELIFKIPEKYEPFK
jgi:hypothetical protein